MADIVKIITLDFLCKLASDEAETKTPLPENGHYMPDDVRKYIIDNHIEWKKDNDHVYMLVVALSASDFYGPNTHGDYFPEKALLEIQGKEEAERYNPPGMKQTRIPRYKTFEWARVYNRHDTSREIGDILKAFWDDRMYRVLCVVRINKDKAPDVERMISSGSRPAFSMGLKEPFDFCLHPDMPVFTLLGWKRIGDVHVGDSVFTHNRNFKEVRSVNISYPSEQIKISTAILPDLIASPNHMIYVSVKGGIIQKPASQIALNDMLIVPLFVSCNENLNKDEVILSASYNRMVVPITKEDAVGVAIHSLFEDTWQNDGRWFSTAAPNNISMLKIFNALWSLSIPAKFVNGRISVFVPGVVWSLLGCEDYFIEPADIDNLGIFFDGAYINAPVTNIIREPSQNIGFYDLSVTDDESFLSYYLVSNCSICGNKRLAGQPGCEHVRLNLNGTDRKTGKRVFNVNKVFYFNDLSVVGQNPADKTAWGLLKVASSQPVADKEPKTNVEMVKTTPPHTEASVIKPPPHLGKIMVRLFVISKTEPDMPTEILQRLASFSPENVFGGLMRSGMVLSPSEYDRYRGFGGAPLNVLPSRLNGILPVIDALMGANDDRSCLNEPLANRVVKLIILKRVPDGAGEPQKASADYINYRDVINGAIINKKASSLLWPAAGFVAPYFLSAHLQRKAFEGYPQGFFKRFIADHPFTLGVIGASGAHLGSAALMKMLGGLKNVKKLASDENVIVYNLLEEYGELLK